MKIVRYSDCAEIPCIPAIIMQTTFWLHLNHFKFQTLQNTNFNKVTYFILYYIIYNIYGSIRI